jgi:two-component system OmpR family sensor kinase
LWGQKIAKPFSSLSNTSSKIISGDLSSRINTRTPIEEFSSVGKDINQMVDSLQSNIEKLRQAISSYGEVFNRVASGDLTARVDTRELKGENKLLGDTLNSIVSILEEKTIELKREKADLQEAYKSLKVLDTMKSDFVSTASHELRTPLTIMRGYCEILHDGLLGEINEEQRSKLAIMIKEIDALLRMASRTLDLSALEAGKLSMKIEDISLVNIAKEVVNELKSIAQEKNQNILVELPELSLVRGDGERIEMVCYNLIQNAIKHTPVGSKIKIHGREYKDYLLLGVSDDGPGMPSHELDKIFDRFYTGEKPRRDREVGTGIGLAVCRGIVEAHGGRIWAESKEGRGMSVYFTLPKK